jgi:hypothetical protein
VDRYDTLIIQILAGARVDAGVVGVGVCDAQAADVVADNATARVSPSVFEIVVCISHLLVHVIGLCKLRPSPAPSAISWFGIQFGRLGHEEEVPTGTGTESQPVAPAKTIASYHTRAISAYPLSFGCRESA